MNPGTVTDLAPAGEGCQTGGMSPERNRILRLGTGDAGELLTLQRAAYIDQARLHDDFDLPPLTQTLTEVEAELASPDVIALGVRDGPRLVASVRLRVDGPVAELGRLVVAPDLQGRGLGTQLLEAVDAVLPPDVRRVELFTGDRSLDNIRLYGRMGYSESHRRTVGAYDLVHFVREVTGTSGSPG